MGSPATPTKPDVAAEKPSKKRDPKRPFERLNARPAATAADGDGAACGCATASDIGADFEQAAVDMVTQESEVFKVIHDAIQAARVVFTSIALLGFLGGPLAAPWVLGFIAKASEILDTLEKKILARLVKMMLPRAVRVIPQWVPVAKPPQGASDDQLRARHAAVTDDQVIEVQGVATRSYQNPIDVPFHQWHRWLNWNVHIKPETGFEKSVSRAKHKSTGVETPIVEDGTIECQFDCGTLWGDHEAKFDNGLGPQDMTSRSGPMMAANWAWPMKGQFVWAAGRWVYDCSRAVLKDEGNQNDKSELNWATLNPCKAIATARVTAFDKFPELGNQAIPVTQFMFFATKKGGYINFDKINDRDYEFIVDLPETDLDLSGPFPLARLGKFEAGECEDEPQKARFLHNTLVLRPRLLKHLNREVFLNSVPAGQQGEIMKLEPKVEILQPEKGKAPTHVKVTVPLTKLGPGVESYGFILSLGWFDLRLADLEKVRKCTLTLKQIRSVLGPDGRIKRDNLEFLDRVLTEVRDDAIDAIADLISGILIPIPFVNIQVPLSKTVATFLWDNIVLEIVKFIRNNAAFSSEDWLFRVGVNGQWKPFFIPKYDGQFPAGQATIPDAKFEFLRLTTEPIVVSMNGCDLDPVGTIMRDKKTDRLLGPRGQPPPPWPEIVVPQGDKKAKQRALALSYVFKLMLNLGDENDPIGFLEHTEALSLGDQLHDNLPRRASFARSVSDQCVLVEDLGKGDYELVYSLNIEKVVPPAS